jgi:hypothetical protein
MQTVPGDEVAGVEEDEVRVEVAEPIEVGVAGSVPFEPTQIARSIPPVRLAKRPASQSEPSQGFHSCKEATGISKRSTK